MKIAIVHEWLVTFAGAERVLSELISAFPEADLYSVVDFLTNEDRAKISGKRAKTTFIQRLPMAKSRYRSYLPLMPIAIEQLDLSAYNLIITSSHAVAKGILVGPDQVHISYVHSPIRYAWDMQHQYLSTAGLDHGVKSWVARAILHYIRIWDSRTAVGVDKFIANSNFISRRINRVYGRKAEVVFPPVDTERFTLQAEKQDYYLTASRLVPYKRVDLIAQAFSGMPHKRLLIVGDGPDADKIRSSSGSNVEFLGYQSDDRLLELMKNARAFVFAAEEDFGIIPVEAQACGTPVIAYGKGGALDTIVDSPDMTKATGIFFEEQSVESLRAAIFRFESLREPISPNVCRQHAESFSSRRFRAEMVAIVEAMMR